MCFLFSVQPNLKDLIWWRLRTSLPRLHAARGWAKSRPKGSFVQSKHTGKGPPHLSVWSPRRWPSSPSGLSRGPPDGAWPEVNDHTDCQQLGWWFPSVIFSSVSIFLFCGYTEIFLTFYVPVVLSSCERSKVNMLPSASLSASLWLICIFYKRQLTNINQCQLVDTGICLNFLLDFSFGVL